MKAAAAAVLRLSRPAGPVRLHPRRPDGGHLGEDDGGGRRTAAQLLQQDHHAGTQQPDALGEAVQGEGRFIARGTAPGSGGVEALPGAAEVPDLRS